MTWLAMACGAAVLMLLAVLAAGALLARVIVPDEGGE